MTLSIIRFARPTNPLPHFSSVLLASQYAEIRETEGNESELSHKKPVDKPTCFLSSFLLANSAAFSSFVIGVALGTGDNVLDVIVIGFASTQSSSQSVERRFVEIAGEIALLLDFIVFGDGERVFRDILCVPLGVDLLGNVI